ncbi:MAG: porin family protein [Chryseolinea sp.]
MKKLLPSLLFLFLSATSYAQLTSGAQTLRLARATYEQGRLHEIPSILEGFLPKFNRQEKVEAYKLLTLSYIYLEEPEKADNAMLSLLRTDHYFEINLKDDPAEFISLYRTFRTDPIYRIGAKIGANATQPNVKSYLPSNDGTSKYDLGIGFQSGLVGEVPFAKNLVLSAELNLQLKSFNYENKVTKTDFSNGETLEYTTEGKEKQTWISIPISIQYAFLKKSKLNPYISLGVSADYLTKATNTFSRSKIDRSSYDEQSENITFQRHQFNFNALASAGIKVKVPNGFAVAEVRYTYGLTTITNSENLYDLYLKSIPTDGYVDALFSINSVSFTVGYVYNVFNPKKRTRK